jgi:ABC-type lipoprotein export system ATPase subunit
MIMEVLRELNDDGMTIIQVTHNEKFAGYGKRIIRLEDGIISGDVASNTKFASIAN